MAQPFAFEYYCKRKTNMYSTKKRLKPSEFNNKTQSSTIEDVNKSLRIVKSRMMEIQTNLFAQKNSNLSSNNPRHFQHIQKNKQYKYLELYKHHNVG